MKVFYHIFSFHFLSFSLFAFLTACSVRLNSNSPDSMVIETDPNTVYMDTQTEKQSELLYQYIVGELSYLDEDFDRALASFAKASKLLEPKVSPPIHEKLAELYVRAGQIEKARSESEKLLKSDPENEEYLILHAGILESIGQFQEARELYSKAISKNSQRADVWILLANVYTREGNLESAAKVLKEVHKKGIDDTLVLFNLGRVTEMQGKKSLALKYYLKIFESEPRSPLVVGDVLRIMIEQEKFDEAEKFCRRVLDFQQENSMARKVLSNLLLGERKLDEALEHFEMLESVSDNLGNETRLKIALIHLDKQNFKEAVRQLLLILASEPNHDEARFYLASIYAGAGRAQDALEELSKIKSDQKMFVKAKVFSAFIWRQEGNLDKAEASITEAHNAVPNDLKVLYYLLVILRDGKKYEQAQHFTLKAIEISPHNEKLNFQYAILLHDMGKIEEANKQMEKVVEINPKNADALNFLAYALAEKGERLDDAMSLVKRALEVSPEDPYFKDTLGWIYFQMENFPEAERALGEALHGAGSDPVIIEHYADILVKLDKKEEAQKLYKQSLEILSAKETLEQEEVEVLNRLKQKIKK